ncbi:AMP-binding protein [Streptomyces sedi]|uniref:AMP-binding protein n=1 Tax=Streptomyces sedi TaxID=555059 RepID=A0A5C4VE66_9ACTN|nr:AMP-binding protein [Streptomyces sedi]TNM34200.1 AMP-binding protein [Streptomyces sedi]
MEGLAKSDDAPQVLAPGTERVHDFLDEALLTAVDAPAVRDASGGWTYRQLAERSREFGAWLDAQGVRRGDRLVVQAPSRRELVAMLYGTLARGVVFVPLNPGMKPFHLRSVLANAEPKLVIGAGAGVARLTEVTEAPVRDQDDVWREADELAKSSPAGPPPAEVTPDDLAVLVYTSGSTAAPKAVMSHHSHMAFAARAIAAVLRYRPDDVVFCRFPISWDYGLYKVLLACLGRSELVLADEESDLTLLRRMGETGATVVPIVPSLAQMIVALGARARDGLPAVRLFTNTGAALPAATIRSLRELFPGVRVVRQYGQTECKRVTVMPPEEDAERPDSVGVPLPGTRVLILDGEGKEVPTGEVGEIVAAGPHVMPGYWRAPEQTARVFRADPDTGEPRLHTGDYGWLDEDGYLYFQGRRDDMFKRRGIRMSTVEIEAAATDVPGVEAACVVPPADGTDLAIVVEGEVESHAVLRELATRLEPAKVPALCRVVPRLPLTAHGKIAHREIAALLKEENL